MRHHLTIAAIFAVSGFVAWTSESARAQLQPVVLYDNLTNEFLLNSQLRLGSQEIGDDVALANFQDGIIFDYGWSVVNFSATNTIRNYTATIRWYDYFNLTLLGSHVLGGFDPELSILPGRSRRSRIQIPNLQIPVVPRMWMTFQFTSVVGGDIEDLGVLTGGPNVVGSSSRFIRNFTTGQDVDLGSDRLNMAFFLNVRPIPTPSALGVFGVAAVLAVRRRRG